jgi:hypothetical protein
MKQLKFLIGILILSVPMLIQADNFEDNEFAEFEDFDAEEFIVDSKPEASSKSAQAQQEKNDKQDFGSIDDGDDIVVEDEDSEFEHFQDEEEFEGFAGGASEPELKNQPKLTMAKNVPMHFR